MQHNFKLQRPQCGLFLDKVSGLQSVALTHDIVEILLDAFDHPGTSFGNATTSPQLLETTSGGAIHRQVSQWLDVSAFFGVLILMILGSVHNPTNPEKL